MTCIYLYIAEAVAYRFYHDVCVQCCSHIASMSNNSRISHNAVRHTQHKMEKDVAHYDTSSVRCEVTCPASVVNLYNNTVHSG